MSIPGISGASYIQPPPAATVTSPQSQTGTGSQQQPQTRVYDPSVPGAKGVAIAQPGAAEGATPKLGSIIDVTV